MTEGRIAMAADAQQVDRVPSDGSLDATLPFLREGYAFVGRRCDRLGSDAFRTRITGRSVICFRGPAWTRLFYGSDAVTRRGAMPAPVLRLLQDKGSVQTLDGAAHRHRKALFTELFLDEARVRELAELFRDTWLRRLPDWEEQGTVCLLTASSKLLAAVACRWAGLNPGRAELAQMAGAMFRMVDQAGRPRIATIAALGERRRTERRLRQFVLDARDGGADPHTPLGRIAGFRDPDGALLPPEVATVELINVLRPIVAVGRFVTFAALALHQQPGWRDRLRDAGNDDLVEPFCEELRRRTPFFPATAAIARERLEWNGLVIPKGQWLMFDLYGTLHDARWFPRPEEFRPERDLNWRDADDRFVPQGGGDVAASHRCPGEMPTLALMGEATRILCRDMRYRVPGQDLSVDLGRIPAQPASGFVISDVRPAAAD